MAHPGWGAPQQPLPGCVRHPDRPTALACQRCGRPSCPECLREAPVGFQCVDCVAQGAREVRQPVTVAGAPVRRGRPQPVVTLTLIAVNVAVFLATVAQSGNIAANYRGSRLFADWALFPPIVGSGEYIRVVGSGFLHYGPIHLLMNMLALYLVGRDVELVLGRARYLAVYLLSLLGGSAAVMWLQTDAVTAGASGAVFGLFGALAVLLVRLRQSPTGILTIVALNVVISVTIPGISLWGHLGGLFAGAVSTAALVYVPQWLAGGRRVDPRQASATGLVALVVVAVVVVALIVVRAWTFA